MEVEVEHAGYFAAPVPVPHANYLACLVDSSTDCFALRLASQQLRIGFEASFLIVVQFELVANTCD